MIKDTQYERWLELMRRGERTARRRRRAVAPSPKEAGGCQDASEDDPILSLWERLKHVRRA